MGAADLSSGCLPDIPGSEQPEPVIVPDLMVYAKSDLTASETRLLRNNFDVPVVYASVKTADGLTDFLNALKGLVVENSSKVQRVRSL